MFYFLTRKGNENEKDDDDEDEDDDDDGKEEKSFEELEIENGKLSETFTKAKKNFLEIRQTGTDLNYIDVDLKRKYVKLVASSLYRIRIILLLLLTSTFAFQYSFEKKRWRIYECRQC